MLLVQSEDLLKMVTELVSISYQCVQLNIGIQFIMALFVQELKHVHSYIPSAIFLNSWRPNIQTECMRMLHRVCVM